MIFQDPMTSLNPVLTIGDQIAEALQVHLGHGRTPGPRAHGRAAGAGGHSRRAEHRLDDYPHQFSGGMRQRVMIAMAISCDPSS